MTQPEEPRFTMPAAVFDAEPINYTPAGGLYSATVPVNLPDPVRLAAGAEIRSTNTAYTVASWDSRYGATNDDKAGTGIDTSDVFPAVVIVTAAECSLVTNVDGQEQARAEYGMRLAEEQQVEEHLAGILAGAVDTPLPAQAGDDAVAVAVGHLEELVRSQRLPVVLHASVRIGALAASKGLVVKGNQTGRLVTPLGSTWVFGAGYSDLGDTIYATGPVTVRRGSVLASEADGHRKNDRLGIAEREAVVSYEGVAVAHEVKETP